MNLLAIQKSDFWVFVGFVHLWLIMSILAKNDSIHVREVWNDNLDQEIALIREIVDDFPYVAMDTEFPGIVVRPVCDFKSQNEYNYEMLKENVNMSKLIQMGFTFSDERGNLPTCGSDRNCIWQFNFREFDVDNDVYASDSIELLTQSGIDFKKNREGGVDVVRFGEALMTSGVLMNEGICWVMFHSCYDFGYLLKLLTNKNLPDKQSEFFNLINVFLPVVYDIKHMMTFCDGLYGGLSKLAELLGVERVGTSHQAGSDSLLTSWTFRKLREKYFTGSLDKYAGILYGLAAENEQND